VSAETTEWLNKNVLVGFTKQRGNAWHYRMAEQGDEPNHYEASTLQLASGRSSNVGRRPAREA
jgi:hypothetical protein